MAPIAVHEHARSINHATHSLPLDQTAYSPHHLEKDKLEPLAIIGLSLKFPQEATTADAFWQMLCDKRCSMTEWPKDRLNIDAFYHPDSNRVDTIPFRGGHFLEESLGKFDAPFFSISSAEAAAMDPQQRLLLETAYRALENAGIPIERVAGSNTSVHTGSFTDDYRMAITRDKDTLPTYAATGIAPSMLAARLSWFFNFIGPCVNLDSACSSSMMAFDLACQGLRNGNTNMALVGGASVALALDNSLPLSNMNFISPDSLSYSFDARANGYGRGEGFGVVLLKRLADAVADGDTIRAVVRSTSSNQDGHTPGITQPSKEAQLRLIRETYAKAGLSMQPTRYVEAHGTGTMIGDPVEASAIGTAFRDFRSSEEPMYIGALKSNIGHLEGTSGIAGIIKTVMVLEAAVIPPNANFETLNPNIDAQSLRITFPQKVVPWPSEGLRRASVMSFGFGGSNSHVIMDDACNFLSLNNLVCNHWSVQAPPSLDTLHNSSTLSRLPSLLKKSSLPFADKNVAQTSPKLLVWSAGDEDGINRLAKVYSTHMSQIASALNAEEAATYLGNLSYTLAARRTCLTWKSFAIARSVAELADQSVKMSKAVRTRGAPKLGFVFTGQGAQYAGMAKDLLSYPVFHNSLRRSEMYLKNLGCQWSLLDEFIKEKVDSNVDDPAYSQPICTALQIALVDLLRVFQIVPSAVLGHSSGEIAAAYCVGYLSHQSACKVAFFRGQCATKLLASGRHRGAMMAVGLPEESVEPYLKGKNDVVVGCINSPRSVTLTGEEVEIDSLKLMLDRASIFCRKLHVNIAYHSPQMREVADDYLALLENLEQGDCPSASSMMISTVTGKPISRGQVQQGQYWVDNMVSQVRFSTAMEHICSATRQGSGKKLGANRLMTPITDLLEVGPHSALQGPIKDIFSATSTSTISYSSVLKRSVSAAESLLDAAGRLHCFAYPVDVCEVNNQPQIKGRARQIVLPCLPGYPFDHSREYWHESRLSKEGYRLRQHPRLDLLGTPAPDWNNLDARWRRFIRASETPWIDDHKINGTVVYPAAGMLVMALEAAKQMADGNKTIAGYNIKDVTFSSPMTIASDSKGTETQLHLRPLGDSTKKVSASEFTTCVNNGDVWIETCRGTIDIEFEAQETEVDAGKESKARLCNYRQTFEEGVRNCDETVDEKRMYEHMKDIGLEYGPAFQGLRKLSYNKHGVANGKVEVFQWSTQGSARYTQPHLIHPTTLDALFQLMLVALSKGVEEDMPTLMPTRIGKLWIAGRGISHPSTSIVKANAQAAFSGRRKAYGSMFALDETTDDVLVSLEMTEVTTVATREAVVQSQNIMKKLCYNFAWKPDLDLLSHRQVSEYCETSRPHRGSDAEFYEDIDYLLIMFMSDASNTGASCSSESHLRHYVTWLKFQLERFHAGLLPNLSSSNSKWTALMQSSEYRDHLIRQVGSTTQGKFFLNLGRNLPQILKGELDPLAFMFRDDSVPEFYREINNTVMCYEPLNQYLDIMCHKIPGLKVLEIGAGTGATTDFIIDALSSHEEGGARTLDCSVYDYTDISPAFFESAADRYQQQHGRMHFKVLDIETDPSKQGFELGTYDLIIAASVLHATKDLETTMRNTRALLKPGGKLVVMEVTEDVIRARFAFGLLPGWWLSEEDYRQRGPCISVTEWDGLLRRSGFSGTDLEIPDYVDERCHEYTTMISTAVEPAPNPKNDASLGKLSFRKVSIIVDQENPMQQSVAQQLKDGLLRRGSMECHVLSLEQAATSANLETTFYISLVESEKSLLSNLDEENLAMLQCIVTKARGLLWVTGGGGSLNDKPQLHLVEGLARVSRTEFNQLVFVTLALEHGSGSDEHQVSTRVRHIRQVFDQILSQPIEDFEPEYIEKNGKLEIGRVVADNISNQEVYAKTQSYQHNMQEFGRGPPLTLHIESPGSLDSLQFRESAPAQDLADGDLEVRIKSTGVNFLDCLTALGQVDLKSLGCECAGVVSRVGSGCEFAPGDRVVGLFMDTYQTYTQGPARCVAKIPEGLSFAEASALPVVFCTAWIALHDTARLQQGESILIHAGAGGTGQAAIQVAKYLGAEVYVTVGSDNKKQLVMDTYGIPEDHIFYSRNTSFAQGIMRTTKNRGVDVVLNSLSGDGLRASWECIGCMGRFIEIGKRDIYAHGNLPMWQFHKNVTFSSVYLSTILFERPSMISKALSTIMELVAEKKLHIPQPFQVFGISEVENVFRLMQSGRNTGKLAIEMREEDIVHTVLQTKPDYQFDTESSYMIVGGLGGLGRSAAQWMASRGAKYLILLSRSGVQSETSIAFVEDLESMGVQVNAPACDVTDLGSLSAVLADCAQTFPPIKGVIQSSMVLKVTFIEILEDLETMLTILKDALFEKMTAEDWKLSIGPKVQGSWNLHTLLPRGMEFFICLSSLSGIIGWAAQANYAAGNTYLDALVRYRITQGEKATSLDLGWMQSEGAVAESTSLSTMFGASRQLIPITQAEFHALLDKYCNPALAPPPTSAADASQAVIGPEVPAAMLDKGLQVPHWMQRRTFRHLRQIGLGGGGGGGGGPASAHHHAGKTIDYAALLREAPTLEDAGRIVTDGLLQKLSKALSLPPEDFDISKPLHAYGVDSLLAVELRNYFAKEVGADVAIFDIMGDSTFETIGVTVARRSQFCPAALVAAT